LEVLSAVCSEVSNAAVLFSTATRELALLVVVTEYCTVEAARRRRAAATA